MYFSRLKALDALRYKKPLCKEHGQKNPAELFGEDVFGDIQLREKLPVSVYDVFRRAVQNGDPLDPSVADSIANAMKEWAMQKGATHFTHWFQPLTGLTAEKHDSFISFSGSSYHRVLKMNFEGKQLIKGEPDASSFPSGGIRSTFEARGYTAWDMESPSFVLNGANGTFLCVPSAFASWTGEALDMKTPLLRSNEALSKASVRVLRLLGDRTTNHCYSQLGVEQEFFVIDRGFYNARPDLIACGRTLIGSQPAKGQQMEDHYFGSLDRRVLAYLQDVEWRLWKLGVPSTTRHNEVAPSQYELAPIYERVSVACDHNMLTMEVLKEVAREHDLACLLYEKPFAGVNGSGKHNNWSICTDKDENLMDPGSTPAANVRFMLFLAAVIHAVSLHGDLLRVAVATPGNEHRLGANEAPPAIISVFLGEQLETVIDDLTSSTSITENNTKRNSAPSKIKLGVNSLPTLPRDASDRNRTSPFAFTGNKFEFRAVGSSQSCARPVAILNSVVADSLNYIADLLEKEIGAERKLEDCVSTVIGRVLKEHRRVLFAGNGYSEEWKKEATEKRGLWHLRTLPEAANEMSSEKNVELFAKLGVLSKKELLVEQHTLFEIFSKSIAIEASCMIAMVQSAVLPVVFEFQQKLMASMDCSDPVQEKYVSNYKKKVSLLIETLESLKEKNEGAKIMGEDNLIEQSTFYRNEIMDAMDHTRSICDSLEDLVDDRLWPFPKYSEMLFLK